jgi:oligoribonuclease NrnB/cAMP/cGMP phosphodiesterase (DHH superfamily)
MYPVYFRCISNKMELNEEVHDHCTRHKLDLHVQFCKTTLFKNNVANVGMKLYNKLPNKMKKLKKLQDFKRKLKYFYCGTCFILWLSICLTEYF